MDDSMLENLSHSCICGENMLTLLLVSGFATVDAGIPNTRRHGQAFLVCPSYDSNIP